MPYSDNIYEENRTQVYIDSLQPALPPYLEALRARAVKLNVPLIRRQTEPLISFFLAASRPERVLEIGTAIGYSALFICENTKGGLSLDTIERSEDWSRIALDNFRELNSDPRKKISLLKGDAADILPTLTPSYDLVFMDAAKGQYLSFLPQVHRLLRPGGLLISDNILQDGDIIKPRTLIQRRDRTIHKRMRDYLYELTHSPDWRTLVLNLADGISVSVKASVPFQL